MNDIFHPPLAIALVMERAHALEWYVTTEVHRTTMTVSIRNTAAQPPYHAWKHVTLDEIMVSELPEEHKDLVRAMLGAGMVHQGHALFVIGIQLGE